MNEPEWLDPDVVLEMHLENLRLFGGSSGIRDAGLLDSALARPKNILAYEPDVSLARLAAAYACGIVKNHPFIDGNKRTGFLAAYTFLNINGVELQATEPEAAVATVAMASGELAEQEYAAWLEDRCEAEQE